MRAVNRPAAALSLCLVMLLLGTLACATFRRPGQPAPTPPSAVAPTSAPTHTPVSTAEATEPATDENGVSATVALHPLVFEYPRSYNRAP